MTYDEDGYPEVRIPEDSQPELERIVNAIRGGECIPFFGAGASMGYAFNGASSPGIPGAWEVTMTLLREAGMAQDSQIAVLQNPASADRTDDLRAAMKLLDFDLFKAANCFLYKFNNRRSALDCLLRREIAKAKEPRPIHTIIAQIQDISTVLTTNYDCLFETACKTYNRDLIPHIHQQFKADTGIFRRCPPVLKPGQVILHKMHGSEDCDESMIITRADYIRYLANFRDPAKGMPVQIFSRLPNSTLLFLGYGVADWDWLTIWEGIVTSYPQGGDEIQSYAVMKFVSAEDRDFLQKRNIQVIKCDLTEFAVALAKEFKLQIPQLGIPQSPPNGRSAA